MQRFVYPDKKSAIYITILAYALYAMLFALLRDSFGLIVGALGVIPVMAASWYFGVHYGMIVAALCILNNIVQLLVQGQTAAEVLISSSEIIGFLVLAFISFVVGNLKILMEERSQALLRLKQYEQDRRAHTDFLELLNEITALALEANSLNSTLKILGERIGTLFKADDCFFALWDEAKQVPIPIAAYGSMSDIYPYVEFESGEKTLTASIMELQRPLAVPNLENSPYISSKVATIYPSRSMLGLPLIAQGRKLGALLLGYKKSQAFTEQNLLHAQLTAEQVSLVLSKSLLLEEERKQVKQLTALHDIALIAIDVDNEDELIHRVADIIGKNLFPDNFGILLLDERSDILHAHPSYRFFSDEERHMMDIPIDQGISGLVARTGKAQRPCRSFVYPSKSKSAFWA
jgi:hypothetical protein